MKLSQWFVSHYDFFKDFAGPTATFAAAAAALVVTHRLGKGQLRIAEEQKNIAHEQKELADLKLKSDLFDRRFAIYEEIRLLLIEVVQRNDVTIEAINRFVRNTDKAVFMFDQGFVDYLIDMRTRAFRLKMTV